MLLGVVAGASTFFGRAGAFDEFGLRDFCLFFIRGNDGGPSAQAAKNGRNLPNEVIRGLVVKPALGAITELVAASDPMLKDGLYN
jgi:hypothetical protein